jgi:hypothetical protein
LHPAAAATVDAQTCSAFPSVDRTFKPPAERVVVDALKKKG